MTPSTVPSATSGAAGPGPVPPAPRVAADRPRRGPRSLAELRGLLRERLPELLATTGVVLLVAAVAGFVVSQWKALDNLGQAGLLVAGSVVLTLQGQWASTSDSRLVRRLVPLSWGAAATLTLVAVQLLGELGLPDAPRAAIAIAGIVALAHAAWAWWQRPGSIVLQLVAVGCALYAVGPIGVSLGDTWGVAGLATWLSVPGEALFGMTGATTDAFAIVATGHLLVGIGWVAVGLHLREAAPARTARIGGSLLLAVAACEFNAMASPVGASIALLVVIAFLVVGIAIRDGLLIAFGSMAALVTGLRTVWSLFSGETAVTVTVSIAGVVLLLAALRLGRARDDRGDADDEPDDGAGDRVGTDEARPGTKVDVAPGT